MVALSAPPRTGAPARAARLLAYAVAVLALFKLGRSVDLAGVGALLARVGPAGLVALTPFAMQVAIESATWRFLLGYLGHAVPWVAALRVTFGAEGVRLCFPGGAVVGDGLRPVLFWRYGGVPMRDGAAVLAVRKLGQVGAQGLFLALGAAAGGAFLAQAGQRLGLVGWLPGLALAVGALLVAAALLLGALLARGAVAARAERLLTRLTGGRLAGWLEQRRAGYAALDGQLAALIAQGGPVLALSGVTALAGWLLDALESYVLLRLIGAPMGLGDAIALEASVSLARALAFAVPGGLGAQDLGYHALLSGVAGGPGAVAFVLLKRVRDVTFSALGLLSRPV